MNMFYKIGRCQEKRNDYIPIDVHWRKWGRDEEWKKNIRNTSESQFNSEFSEFLGSIDTLVSPVKLNN